MENHKNRSCEGKRGYCDNEYAYALQVMRRMKMQSGDTFQLYRCNYCGKFHIGHSIKVVNAYNPYFVSQMCNVKRMVQK